MSVSLKQLTCIKIKLSQINLDKNKTFLFFYSKRKTKKVFFFYIFYEFIES
jgi:hypothetical protein